MRIEVGKRQKLTVIKKVDFGVYLAPGEGSEERVLLPAKQVPAGCSEGDRLEVFVYRDSKDRLISTTARPALCVGEVAALTVAQTGKVGAFLSWGLEKDLFLPFREQTMQVKAGDSFPVALYVDKSGRLCATMKIYHYLRTDSPYKKDDRVTGYIYEISRQFGAFVAVDDQFSALIPPREMYGQLQTGDRIEARVTAVHEDGKLDLSVRDKAWMMIGKDAERVMEEIGRCGGALPFNDKAAPELIRERMQMSKNEFKRAVGHLLKEGRVEITENGIRRK
ncbi:MAG TPA: S1 RNA-binding domain-containing protein [Candidatus Eisenbergiella merdavium]|uniref:S1 RNA-binding domain-containing protein n=1 Tax=Candidatus Eisenbergiella merdavium TaxID=2838551 RepID=A0A9D2NEP3_9FIRM|nr:S1 RNA-binding domain-containing protein [Candidatus Eisenbergiella merdavium]